MSGDISTLESDLPREGLVERAVFGMANSGWHVRWVCFSSYQSRLIDHIPPPRDPRDIQVTSTPQRCEFPKLHPSNTLTSPWTCCSVVFMATCHFSQTTTIMPLWSQMVTPKLFPTPHGPSGLSLLQHKHQGWSLPSTPWEYPSHPEVTYSSFPDLKDYCR